MTSYQRRVQSTVRIIESESLDLFVLNLRLGHAVRYCESESKRGSNNTIGKEYRDALVEVIRDKMDVSK